MKAISITLAALLALAFRHADVSLSDIIAECEYAADDRMALRMEEERVR